jgi:hypothetical protein
MNSTIKTWAIALAMGLSVSSAFAAATAFDTAANYAGTWGTGAANLGSGFGAWQFDVENNNNPPYAGTYLDQTSYGNPDGVLSIGYAWGTYANGGPPTPQISMARLFTAGPSGSTSLYNQTFSVGIGSAGIGGSGSSITVEVGLAFFLSYSGGGADNFLLNGNPIPVNFSDLAGGFQFALAVSGPLYSTTEGYTLTLSPFAGGPAFFTQSGTFDSSSVSGITSFFDFIDTNTSNDQFVNNLSISPEGVPEPSSMVMLGFAGLTTLLAIRRRK